MSRWHRPLAGAAAALLAMAAQAQQAPWPDPDFAADPDRVRYTRGADIYRYACLGCHQAQGRGARGAATYPALVNNPRLAHPSYPIHVVLHGHNAMPPFKDMLNDAQVVAVVNYLLQDLGNAPQARATEANVRAARRERGP